MADHDRPELAELLAELAARLPRSDGTGAGLAGSDRQAVAMYYAAARLAEMQLELSGQGRADDEELAMTRSVLVGAHRLVLAAIDRAAAGPGGRPALHVVDGGASGRRAGR